MGYSSRYHAASLAAVFLALAIGVLIGLGLGNSPRKSLERSLKSDIKNARSEADRLGGELGRERDFGSRVYPVLAGKRLRGERIGVIAIGNLPRDVSGDIEQTLQPTGAKLVSVAVVRVPPSLDEVAKQLPKRAARNLASGGKGLDRYARQAGRQLVKGGSLLRRTRDQLLSRASGSLGPLDDVILVRNLPADLPSADKDATSKLETGLVEGIHAAGRPVVAVERTDSDPSSVGFFDARQVSTVDDVDLVAGQVAMVFSLLGAEGNFGVKGGADRLLPELLVPSRPRSG
ncbi:MAG: hypothetical protein QOJ38_1398 [Solirubrobacterales bacterium]|jgi:hypothetical protein|nr:hypothetical protein [Solirubrobacterales bacterium]